MCIYSFADVDEQNMLPKIIALATKHSKTLGFMPAGAFREYALKDQILYAADTDGELQGYLLYRLTARSVSLTHLCVDTRFRKLGIAESLVHELVKRTSNEYAGIGLFCRRDYGINNVWESLGFVPISEKVGRSHFKKELTHWWRDFQQIDLFSFDVGISDTSRICIVLDANVFYDLHEHDDRPEAIESKAMLSDWFSGLVEIYVSDEMYVEIERHSDAKVRKRDRARLSHFNQLSSELAIVGKLQLELTDRWPVLSAADKSDRKHLSHAIASDADYFVTRDAGILSTANEIEHEYGLLVRRPAQIILDADRLRDEVSYRPARLAGTLYKQQRVDSADLDSIIFEFSKSTGMSHSDIRKLLLPIFSDPTKHHVYISKNVHGKFCSIFALTNANSNIVRIPVFLISDGRNYRTIATYLVLWLIKAVAKNSGGWINVDLQFMPDEIISVFTSNGFRVNEDKLVRLAVRDLVLLEDFNEGLLLEKYGNEFEQNNDKSRTPSRIERDIWPSKLLDICVPCYIVPIKAGWARDLFDESLSSADLFGPLDHIAFQDKGVYYYSVIGAKLKAPARILWYVSQDGSIDGSGAVRAASMLMEHSVDTAKNLHKRFSRFGVYTWKNVYETAGKCETGKLSALYFDQTELFSSPLIWSELQVKLANVSGNKTLVTALEIPSSVYFEIYREGVELFE